MAKLLQKLGLEAIAFQGADGHSKLFDDITEEINKIRAGKVFTARSIANSSLNRIIEEHTGISTAWEYSESPDVNAWVCLPDINKNHPLLLDFERAYFSGATLDELAKQTNSSKFAACVDTNKCRVYGAYTKITARAVLTDGILSCSGVGDDDIAAVVIHELGHVFTNYELMLGLVTINYASATAVREILKLNTPKQRVEILTKYEKVVGVELGDKETMVKTDDQGIILSQVLVETFREKRDSTGAPKYSYNACEFVADQFCVRHGAGLALARGLSTIYSMYKDPSTFTWAGAVVHKIFSFCLLNIYGGTIVGGYFGLATGTLAAGAFGFVIGAVMFTLIALCMDPMGDIYDTPKDRISRIIREYNAALKNPKLKGEARQYYLSELDSLYVIEKSLTNNRAWNEVFWAYLVPSGRKAVRQQAFQQDIEKLTNNNLFAASAAFK